MKRSKEVMHLWVKRSNGHDPKLASDKAALTHRLKTVKVSLAPIKSSKMSAK